jgi:hypothetical protein
MQQNRFVPMLARFVLVILCALPIKVFSKDNPSIPKEVSGLVERIRHLYQGTMTITTRFEAKSSITARPYCPHSEGEENGSQFEVPVEPWILYMDMKLKRFSSGEDVDLFSELTVEIRKLAHGADGLKNYRLAKAKGCAMRKNGEAIFQAGGFWISLEGTCSDGHLFSYEVGDFMKVFDQSIPAPSEILYGKCGWQPIEFLTPNQVVQAANETRIIGGVKFPDARKALRKL